MKVAVIGYGYWGPNLVRNFAETPGCEVAGVCDLDPQRLTLVHRRYPTMQTCTSCPDLVNDPQVDAVAVATSVSSHFELAMAALKAGKHVLVEKPLAATSEEAARLVDEAERRNLVLMVDHTFVYSGAVRKIRELIDAGEVGDLYYYDSVRVNLGLFQRDVGVLWDLAVHDLAIIDYLLPGRPQSVAAVGIGHVPNVQENIAYLTLLYEPALIAHVHVNWLAPVKVRSTLIGGSRKMIVYDDLQPSEKVKVYDCGVTVQRDSEEAYNTRIGYRMGDMWAPQLDRTEPLSREVREFMRCIEEGDRPVADGRAGLRVLRVLEGAALSMRQSGRPVPLPEED
jgi:predicted dehydrogenase